VYDCVPPVPSPQIAVRAASRYRLYCNVSVALFSVRGVKVELLPLLSVIEIAFETLVQWYETDPVVSVGDALNTLYVPKLTEFVEIVHPGAASATRTAIDSTATTRHASRGGDTALTGGRLRR
jgi:hypothetical protein